MDRLIYLAMSGAKATMQRQETLANNLANVSTVGFRAELAAFRAVPVEGSGASTRVYSLESTPGYDATPGQMGLLWCLVLGRLLLPAAPASPLSLQNLLIPAGLGVGEPLPPFDATFDVYAPLPPANLVRFISLRALSLTARPILSGMTFDLGDGS